jgi:hypothetical protein
MEAHGARKRDGLLSSPSIGPLARREMTPFFVVYVAVITWIRVSDSSSNACGVKQCVWVM